MGKRGIPAGVIVFIGGAAGVLLALADAPRFVPVALLVALAAATVAQWAPVWSVAVAVFVGGWLAGWGAMATDGSHVGETALSFVFGASMAAVVWFGLRATRVIGAVAVSGVVVLIALSSVATPTIVVRGAGGDPGLDAVIIDAMPRVPGASVVVIRDGVEPYVRAFGTAGDRDMTIRTPVLLGSVSKSFTGWAAASLAVDDRIDLDARVREVAPELDLGGTPADLTTRQLLHHTSGIPTRPTGWIPLAGYRADTSVVEATAQLADDAPRTAGDFQYSNANYLIAGAVLEAATGRSFAEIVEDEVFGPLGLDDAMVGAYRLGDVASAGYQSWLGNPMPARAEIPPSHGPFGGVAASAEDMEAYLSALLAGGPIVEEILDAPDDYGFGWWIDGDRIEHGGLTIGASADVVWDRGEGIAIAVMTNAQSASGGNASRIRRAIEDHLAGESLSPRPLDRTNLIISMTWVLLVAVTSGAGMRVIDLAAGRRSSTRRRILVGLAVRVLAAIALVWVVGRAAPWAQVWRFGPDVGALVVATAATTVAIGLARLVAAAPGSGDPCAP